MSEPLTLSLKERAGMCIIDNKYFFNYDNPGPVQIDLSTLTPAGIRQCVYNINRGILVGENTDQLQELVNAQLPPPTTPNAPAPRQVPVRPRQEIDPAKAIEDDMKQLKNLLRSSQETVMKEAVNFRAARLRRLRELEEEGQARAGVLTFINTLLTDYQSAVSSAVGDEDVGDKTFAPGVKLASTQVSDVVESEMTTVVIGEHEGNE